MLIELLMLDASSSIVMGPFESYIILLGGGGKVTKRLHKITKGEGGIHQRITLDYKGRGSIWFYPSIDKVSKKIQILLVKINILRYNTKKNIY